MVCCHRSLWRTDYLFSQHKSEKSFLPSQAWPEVKLFICKRHRNTASIPNHSMTQKVFQRHFLPRVSAALEQEGGDKHGIDCWSTGRIAGKLEFSFKLNFPPQCCAAECARQWNIVTLVNRESFQWNGRRGGGKVPLDFEIWHFSRNVFFSVSKLVRWKFVTVAQTSGKNLPTLINGRKKRKRQEPVWTLHTRVFKEIHYSLSFPHT